MAILDAHTRTTSSIAADTAVKVSPGKVYWLTVSAGATGGSIQIEDSTDGSGTPTVKWEILMPATSVHHFNFDPPIRCALGIFVDVPGTNILATIAHD